MKRYFNNVVVIIGVDVDVDIDDDVNVDDDVDVDVNVDVDVGGRNSVRAHDVVFEVWRSKMKASEWYDAISYFTTLSKLAPFTVFFLMKKREMKNSLLCQIRLKRTRTKNRKN